MVSLGVVRHGPDCDGQVQRFNKSRIFVSDDTRHYTRSMLWHYVK